MILLSLLEDGNTVSADGKSAYGFGIVAGNDEIMVAGETFDQCITGDLVCHSSVVPSPRPSPKERGQLTDSYEVSPRQGALRCHSLDDLAFRQVLDLFLGKAHCSEDLFVMLAQFRCGRA